MTKHWRDRPGDWWLDAARPRTRRKPRRKQKPETTVCSHCNQTISVRQVANHQQSDRCRILQRERKLEEQGYVRLRGSARSIEIARHKVVVADRSTWVPRWAMITIHTMVAWSGKNKHGTRWAYQEAFDAVSVNPDCQSLVERIALQRVQRELVSPHMLLTLRPCPQVIEAVLSDSLGFGARDFKTLIIRCGELIDTFPEAPLSEHLALAVSATLSNTIVQAKIQQRPVLKDKRHRYDKSAQYLEEVVRKVGGHDAIRAYMEDMAELDAQQT